MGRQVRIQDLTDEERWDVVRGISAVKIYYLYRGRNAWYNTWVTHYSQNCFQPTLEGARRQAEQLRCQGSVFYVQELPALLLMCEIHSLLVTEINTSEPLGHFDDRIYSSTWNRDENGRREFRRGMTLGGASYMFSHYSDCWRVRPERENSVITEILPATDSTWERIDAKPLKLRMSSSQGSAYNLMWSEVSEARAESENVSQHSVLTLARRAKKRAPHPFLLL